MTWAAPAYCWLLLLLIPAIWLRILSVRSESRAKKLLGLNSGDTGWLPMHHLLLLVAFLLLLAALCRPEYGEETAVRETFGMDILIALDCSKSMLADDLSPTRLAAAKKAVFRLVDTLQGDRIGLIPFAGNSFMTCPLTSDYGLFKELLASTGSGSIPLEGSDLGTVAAEVIRGFSGKKPQSCLLIIISDGEDFGDNGLSAAGRLKERGFMVRTLLAGSERGAVIPLPGGGFLKDRQGQVVVSRASRKSLRHFSEPVQLDSEGAELMKLHDEARAVMELQSLKEVGRRKVERFQIPLGGALSFLFLAAICSRRRQ